MADLRVTQDVLEVALTQTPDLRATQAVVEAAVSEATDLRVTQAALEVAVVDTSFPLPGSSIRVTQAAIEAAYEWPYGTVKVSQIRPELLQNYSSVREIRLSQVAPETVIGAATDIRVSQIVVEIIKSFTCEVPPPPPPPPPPPTPACPPTTGDHLTPAEAGCVTLVPDPEAT